MRADLFGIFAFFSFWLGACIASFLNVVIWRVPRGESIVSPPSHCPRCGALIRWFENIPILSWLALRGRCSRCHLPISPRYVIVEAMGGGLFLAAFLSVGLLAPFLWVWISLMIVGTFIDFDHQLLPDFVTVGGMVYGVALALASSLLWLVRFFGSRAFGREAMGLGDVFLMGAIGALFGPLSVIMTLIVSSITGSIVGCGLIAVSKARLGNFVSIPFGPYLCLGCLAWMFYGPELVGWYVNLMK